MTEWNGTINAEFRADNGRGGGPFAGANLGLSTTTGASSGAR